ncbi:MAG: hypothetical protein U5K31_09090 [Balneolaceae bacterium]|nr:hypothetical protein [Balneolaceae bacterium]
MKFQFKYRSLLKIRRHEQKLQQQKLAELLESRQEMSRRLERLLDRPDPPALGEGGRHSVQGMRRGYTHRMSHLKEVWELQEMLERLGQDIEEQRGRLLEASKKTRMLEKLESQDKMRFLEELQRREQLQQNEIATQLYNRAS